MSNNKITIVFPEDEESEEAWSSNSKPVKNEENRGDESEEVENEPEVKPETVVEGLTVDDIKFEYFHLIRPRTIIDEILERLEVLEKQALTKKITVHHNY
jgi:hypothetical protein